MFLPEPNGGGLRQGDILADVPFPLVSTADLRFLGTVELNPELTFKLIESPRRGDPNWLTCQIPVRLGFGAVISQCCNIQAGKLEVHTLAIARLIPVSPSITGERLDSLRANKYPLNPADPGYINLFHVPPHDRLRNQEWVVDYNQVFSIAAADFNVVLRHKILEMDDDSRIRFKIKLGAALARMTEEELDLGHEWLQP